MFSLKQQWNALPASTQKKIVLCVFIIIHVIISYTFIAYQNITYDEPSYIEYSKRWLHGKPERVEALDDSKTPIISIVWLPRIVRQIINPNYQLNDYGRKDQKEGRYMMIVFSVLTIIYLFKFIQLFQLKYWYAVFVFFIIDPLFIAYAVLINSDLASGFILLAIIFHLLQYLINGKEKHFFIACFFFGVGLITKHTFLFLVPILWLIIVWIKRRVEWKKIIYFFLITVFIINAGFYFRHSFKTFGSYQFKSNTLIAVQKKLSVFKNIPVPLPETYVQSIDLLQYHAQLGGNENNTYTGVYLLQQIKLHGSFWNYYLVHSFYKFPISILLLLCIGCYLFIKRKSFFNKKYLVILITVAWLFFCLSFFNSFQIGVRHLLLIIPLMYILLAIVINQLLLQKHKMLIAVLCLVMFISVARYFPYLIPYTNELVFDKKKVFDKIMDSSIDYGQSDSLYKQILAKDSLYKIPNAVAAKGKYLLSMKSYVEQLKQSDTTLHWLIKYHQPTKHYAFVFLEYEVK